VEEQNHLRGAQICPGDLPLPIAPCVGSGDLIWRGQVGSPPLWSVGKQALFSPDLLGFTRMLLWPETLNCPHVLVQHYQKRKDKLPV
jgi:hypothetical protein